MVEKTVPKHLKIPNRITAWWKKESKLTPYNSFSHSERTHRLRAGLYLAILAFAGSRITDSSNATFSITQLRNATLNNAFLASECHSDKACNAREIWLIIQEYTNSKFWENWYLEGDAERASLVLETESIKLVYQKDKILFDQLAEYLPKNLNSFDLVGGLAYVIADNFAYDTVQSEALDGNGAYLESLERVLIDGKMICTGSMITTFGILKSAGYPVVTVQFSASKNEEDPNPVGHALIGLRLSKKELYRLLKDSNAIRLKSQIRTSFLSQYAAFQVPDSEDIVVVFDTTANATILKPYQDTNILGEKIQQMQITPFNHNNDLGAVDTMNNPGTLITLVDTQFSATYITVKNDLKVFRLNSFFAEHQQE